MTKRVTCIEPRGFCAGVVRAVETVQRALALWGPPVHVLGDLVHNERVQHELLGHGAVFVRDVASVPANGTVILSAHGSQPAVYDACQERRLRIIDTTCPLVRKVHGEVRRFAREGLHVIIVGHRQHAEVIGLLGQLDGDVTVIESLEDVDHVALSDDAAVGVVTQTTLAVRDTEDILAALRTRFPGLRTPSERDICYATQNRQDGVRAAVDAGADAVVVVGSMTSSNSLRLVEVARGAGVEAELVEGASVLRAAWLEDKQFVAVTSAASAPETAVIEVVEVLLGLGYALDESLRVAREDVEFAIAPALRARSETPA